MRASVLSALSEPWKSAVDWQPTSKASADAMLPGNVYPSPPPPRSGV